MERYKNLSGKSGVIGYALAPGSIAVQFQDGWTYLYTDHSAGADNIARMHCLALSGRGLSTFIAQTIRRDFECRWEG